MGAERRLRTPTIDEDFSSEAALFFLAAEACIKTNYVRGASVRCAACETRARRHTSELTGWSEERCK